MKRIHFLSIICVAVFLSACTNLSSLFTPQKDAASSADNALLTVSFLDVGQGDSSFIQLPGGKTILIDAGDSGAAETIMTHINSCNADKIDYLVATHPHADHIGSMRQIVEQFEIGEIYMPRVSHNSKTYEKLLLAIQNKGLRIHTARAGLLLEPEPGISLSFIAPCSESYEEKNDYSAVIRLTYEQTSFLFTGDAEKVSEQEMLTGGATLTADVLKVGHHGSKTSSHLEFLQAVQPQYAVISVGADNSYDHPHRVTLNKLNDLGITVFRTDENGTVTAISDGKTIRMKGER